MKSATPEKLISMSMCVFSFKLKKKKKNYFIEFHF